MPRISQVACADAALDLEELDAFDPPSGFEFEEELLEATPRSVPDDLRRQASDLARRRAVLCGSLGAMLITLEAVPFVRQLAQGIPLFGYLHWIGSVLVVVGVYLGFRSFVPRVRNQQFLQYGTPTIARVRKLWLQPHTLQDGTPLNWVFRASIEYFDDDEQDLRLATVASREIPTCKKDRLDVTYRVGDYVTALRLGGGPDAKVNLYGFLDLKPGEGVVESSEVTSHSTLSAVGVAAVFVSAIALFAWIRYCFAHFEPLDHVPWSQIWMAYVVGSAVALAGGWSVASRLWRRETQRREGRNALAAQEGGVRELALADIERSRWTVKNTRFSTTLGLGVIGLIFCNMATVLSCWAANALLDRSPPALTLAQVTDLVVEQEKVQGLTLFRSYVVKFRLPGDGQVRSFNTTAANIEEFRGPFAMASVRRGYFGWKWVDDVRSLQNVAPPAKP